MHLATKNEPVSIGYQGIKGAFSYQASADYFPDGHYRGYRTFQECLRAIADKEVDYGMIPVENSTAGRVMDVYNLLPDSGLYITGEYLLPIHHCLMVPFKAFRGMLPKSMSSEEAVRWKSSPLTAEEKARAFNAIREVHSHTQALAQCRLYLDKHLPKAVRKEVYDTAGAARDIVSRDNAEIAAIASKSAAENYDMLILQENIEDISSNETRFLVLARQALKAEDIKEPALTTLLFETAHEPGALLQALNVFNRHGITLTKLETYMAGPMRPYPTFYVDVGANLTAKGGQPVLEELRQHTKNIKIMGSYAACPRRGQGSFLAVK